MFSRAPSTASPDTLWQHFPLKTVNEAFIFHNISFFTAFVNAKGAQNARVKIASLFLILNHIQFMFTLNEYKFMISEYIKARLYCCSCSGLSISEKDFLIRLSTVLPSLVNNGDISKAVYIDFETLAKETGSAKRTIQLYFKKLKQLNFISSLKDTHFNEVLQRSVGNSLFIEVYNIEKTLKDHCRYNNCQWPNNSIELSATFIANLPSRYKSAEITQALLQNIRCTDSIYKFPYQIIAHDIRNQLILNNLINGDKITFNAYVDISTNNRLFIRDYHNIKLAEPDKGSKRQAASANEKHDTSPSKVSSIQNMRDMCMQPA